jgi:uncharacterized repeat protein (TIGR02543 family)
MNCIDRFRRFSGAPSLIVAAAVLLLLITACYTACAQAETYKYQMVDVPGTMGSQPFTAAVKVNDAETEFTLYLSFMGMSMAINGEIVGGAYKIKSEDRMAGMLASRMAGITDQLTDSWIPVNAEPGKICKVTFKSNYDKQADVVMDVPSADIIIGPTLNRYGYTFEGYFFDQKATKPLKLDAAAKGDVTLYAGWEKWDKETRKYMNIYSSLMEKGEYIMERPKAYEFESFTKFYELAFGLFLKVEAAGKLANKEDAPVLEYAMKTMDEVVRIADPEEYSWYIWGDEMPMAVDAGRYEFFGCLDNEKWRPFLVPYMLEDQSKVKANIIVVAGGGYFLRSNIEEAYSTAMVMNDLGYNCFVLQRRVSPYPSIDSSIDLQRAVRYLNYHAEEYGIAKIENMVTSGFSGGGGTITNAAKTLYGAVSPSTVYPSYIDDDIDKLNSDVDAMLVIYSSGDLKDCKNPNYPAVFLAYGTLDGLVDGANVYYKQLKEKGIFAEVHGFAGAPHGFGAGTGIRDYTGVNPLGFAQSTDINKSNYEGSNKPYLLAYTGAQQWTKLADTFLDQVFKYKPISY